MLQAAEPVVLAVLFLNAIADSGHSTVFPSPLVFWLEAGFCGVRETLIFLSDDDEVQRL